MATSKGLKFSDPPPNKRHPYDWDQIAKDLRARPGEWALIFEGGRHSLVTALRLGIKALPREEGFEIRTTNNVRPPEGSKEKRTCDLYLRYNPANRSK